MNKGMTGDSLSHEDAVAECNALAAYLGQRMAKIIISKTVLHELEPDQVDDRVRHCIDDARDFLLAGGASEHDAEAASRAIYTALVKEGARLSRSLIWEAGSA